MVASLCLHNNRIEGTISAFSAAPESRGSKYAHGVHAKYAAGCRCAECRAANSAYQRSLRGRPPPKHGTASAYQNYACRCDLCKQAGAELNRKNSPYRKKWVEANREKVNAWQRAYVAANPELHNARLRDWKRKNRARVAEQRSSPAAIEAARKRKRAYYEKNPEKRREWDAKRRALKRGARVETVKPLVVFERDGYICRICGKPTIGKYPNPESASLDHIVPLSRGGSHSYENVQCAHLVCNMRRGAGDLPAQMRLIA